MLRLAPIHNMDELDKCYKILRVSPDTSYKRIRKSYNNLMLKYHPSKPGHRHQSDYFVDLVLSFDLISKIEKYAEDFSKSNVDIYQEWVNLDRAFALMKAEQYIKMKYSDFEKEFLPAFFGLIRRFMYLIYFLAALIAVIFPIIEYNEGNISGWKLFCFSFGLTIPFFIGIYRARKDERFPMNRIWFKWMLKSKLNKLLHKRVTPDDTQYKELGTKS